LEQVFDWKRGYSAGARFGVGVKKGNLRKLDKLPAPPMQLKITDSPTHGLLLLTQAEPAFNRMFFRDRKDKLLTIAWNPGPEQTVVIDEIVYAFPPQSILPLMVNQSFRFERPEAVIAWQFNREFYCIVDHDKEVSCVGFLFYGAPESFFVRLQPDDERKISLLFQVFVDEFGTVDPIQVEMLRMLLKRLIILVTRLAKEQFIDLVALPETQFDVVRQFNLLVENHYRHKHRVADYADLLNRSPKTLSNWFALYNQKSPLQVIHDRIILEAKRLLLYTDKNSKEIAYELGFEEVAHFGRFFKKNTGLPPGAFKQDVRSGLARQAPPP
jgi:AraC-like DNA-binding protein